MQPRLKIPSIAFRHLGRKYFGTFAAFLSLSGISALAAGAVYQGTAEGSGGIDTGMKISSLAFTAEAWVRPQSGSGGTYVLGQYGYSIEKSDFSVCIDASNPSSVRPYVFWRLAAQDGGNVKMFADAYTPANVWTHLAVVHDGEVLLLYVDGTLAATTNVLSTALPTGTGNNLTIAALSPTPMGGQYNGQISDVRLWNTARSGPEIRADMGRRLAGTETGLTGYWPLDDGEGNDVSNRVPGTPDGTLIAGEWAVTADHPFPSASYSFTSNVNYVATFGIGGAVPFDTHTRIATSNFTIEAWVKASDISGENIILGQYMSGMPGDFALRLTDGRPTMWMRGAAQDANNAVVASNGVPAGQWVHVVGVFDGATMKIFRDGVLNGTVACTNPSIRPAQSANLVLGGLRIADNHFRGRVCDVRYWTKARTEHEIAAALGARLTGCEDGLSCYWPLDEEDGNYARNLGALAVHACSTSAVRVVDALGPYHDYAISNRVYKSTASGGATSANTRIVTEAFTLEAWVCPSDVSSENDIVAQYVGNASTNDLILNVQAGGQGRIFFRNFGSPQPVLSSTRLAANGWTHLAAVCDGQVLSLYVNGEQEGTAVRSAAAGKFLPPAVNLALAGLTHARNPFRGLLCDVRAWSTARTAAEIKENYRVRLTGTEPNLIGYWPMDGGGDETMIESIAYPRIRQSTRTGSWVVPERRVPFQDKPGIVIIIR